MPGLIEDYVQVLLSTAAHSPIISASNIVLDKYSPRSSLIPNDLLSITQEIRLPIFARIRAGLSSPCY
jgi:hypothetical protein